jgi:hypothetical protein
MRALALIVAAWLSHGSGSAAIAPGPLCGRVVIWKLPPDPTYSAPMIGPDSTQDRIEAEMWAHHTKARLDIVRLTLEEYCLAQSKPSYPRTLSDLLPFSKKRLGGAQCKFREDDFLDYWGRPIYYELRLGLPYLVFAGRDGRFTTSDDIAMPEASDTSAMVVDVTKYCKGFEPKAR